jgi:hypothetical protein
MAPVDRVLAEDIDVSTPYLPTGPADGYLSPPAASPQLAADVVFHSPVLTLRENYGPEFWQGENPLIALGEDRPAQNTPCGTAQPAQAARQIPMSRSG